ncbi:unnamed protein product [Ilex paraguariensis]|uniref:Kinesin-like protein n=1 Tax=Ilex paraguariensis TaxID=185542 RepID=A0ABC8UT05_9AQUA
MSAILRRKVAHTGLNDVSSRSHGVLVISVSAPCDDGSGKSVTGKLNLIDLAGNEDNRRTCNEGIRLQESAKINQSLFALSNVIYALNNNKPRVPYRESKLTRILQDSLGGTSRTLMVACLNPGEYQESVHTVSLAARSRHISNFVPSAQKQDTPKVQVDMEAKLYAWLESKGKTKSKQRIRVFGSPFPSRTPRSVSSMKRHGTHKSSAKTQAIANQGASSLKEREVHMCCSNLFDNGGLLDTAMGDLAAERKTNEFRASADRIVLDSTCVPDEPLDDEREPTTIKGTDFAALTPTREKSKALPGSLRKVLSPINSNINIEHILSRDQIYPALSDPKTPSILMADNNYKTIGTPLDKFNARSSNLKGTLAQEYVEFLNMASREELLELKGIGRKMAEYILELRETSPLKSLSDLEKIGLSSKQIHNMFGRAARGIFG